MISNKNIINNPSRKNIYTFISKNPGLYFREISRGLNIPVTTLNYHLNKLEKNKKIMIFSENRLKRYYVTDKIGKKEKELLNIIREEASRNIILYIISHGVASQIELSKELDITSAAVFFHLKKLKKIGIIDTCFNKKRKIVTKDRILVKRNKVSTEQLYAITNDDIINMFFKLIPLHANTIKDGKLSKEIINAIKEVYSHYESNKNVFKKKGINGYNNVERGLDEACDLLNELFRPTFIL